MESTHELFTNILNFFFLQDNRCHVKSSVGLRVLHIENLQYMTHHCLMFMQQYGPQAMFEKYQETLLPPSHKTTLLLTSCLFSFSNTWQMRLICPVNSIHRLLVKRVALSSWWIVQAAVSNNILLSMFNSSHCTVYRDLVLFPMLTWIQHKHEEQRTQHKITSLLSQLWSGSRQHSALVQERSQDRSLKLKLPGAISQVVLSNWPPVATNTKYFVQRKIVSIFRYLHSWATWCIYI